MENEIFEKMSIPKAFFKLALPVVFSMAISLIYNMVDTWFIAKTQNTDLIAGVSICAPVFTLMIAFGDIFGLGGSSLISRMFGEKDYEGAKKASSCCIYLSIGFGLLVTLIMMFFRTQILHVLGADELTFSYATSYYTWLAIGSPAIIMSIVPSNLLRTEGLALQAMIGSLIGSVINIILDPIFIFGLGLGAGGAAMATVLSNVVAVIIFLLMIHQKSQRLSISIKDFKVNMKHLQGILAIGLPASITNIMQSFAIMMTNRYLVTYGNDKIAVLGIALKVNMIIMLIMVGFAFGAQPLLGYNYGAKNIDRLKKIIKFDIQVQIIFSVVSVLIFAVFAPQIIHLFMKDEAIVSSGALILRCLMMTAPFTGVILVFTTLFQAEGKAMPAFVLSVSRQGVVFIISLIALSSLFGYMGVICAQAAADVVTCLIAVGMYFGTKGVQ